MQTAFNGAGYNTSPAFTWNAGGPNNVPGWFYKPAGQTYLIFETAYPSSGTTAFPTYAYGESSPYQIYITATGAAAFIVYKMKLTLPNTWTALSKTTITSATYDLNYLDCYVAFKGTQTTTDLDYPLNAYFPASTTGGWGGTFFDTTPTAPTLSGSVGNAQNQLTWTIPGGDIITYTLKRDTTTVYTGSANSYTDTGLTNGTAYGYTVTAGNTAGTSPSSNTIPLAPTAGGTSGGGGLSQIQLESGLKNYFTHRVKESMALGLVAWAGYAIVTQFRWRSR
jgi:hypothetical protein